MSLKNNLIQKKPVETIFLTYGGQMVSNAQDVDLAKLGQLGKCFFNAQVATIGRQLLQELYFKIRTSH